MVPPDTMAAGAVQPLFMAELMHAWTLKDDGATPLGPENVTRNDVEDTAVTDVMDALPRTLVSACPPLVNEGADAAKPAVGFAFALTVA